MPSEKVPGSVNRPSSPHDTDRSKDRSASSGSGLGSTVLTKRAASTHSAVAEAREAVCRDGCTR